MNLPRISIFKTRLFFIVFCVLVFSFIVGAVKNAFGEYNPIPAWNTSCYIVGHIRNNDGYCDSTDCSADNPAIWDGSKFQPSPSYGWGPGGYHIDNYVIWGLMSNGTWAYVPGTGYGVTTPNGTNGIEDSPLPVYEQGSFPSLNYATDCAPEKCNWSEQQMAIAACGGISNAEVNEETCEVSCRTDCPESQIEALNQTCGGTLAEGKWHWLDEANCEAECIDPCEDYREAFYEQCRAVAGLVDDSNYDNENCSGLECDRNMCDGEGEETILEATARCKSIGEWLYEYDEDTCKGTCKPCDSEPCDACETAQHALDSECGGPEGIAWHWVNKDLCDGACKDDEECYDKYKALKDACLAKGGAWEGDNFDWELCRGGKCNDYGSCEDEGEETKMEALARCAELGKDLEYYDEWECKGICRSDDCTQQQYKEQKAKCNGYGIKSWNAVKCEATCKDCKDQQQKAQDDCKSKGGKLYNWSCKEENGIITDSTDWECDYSDKNDPNNPDNPNKKKPEKPEDKTDQPSEDDKEPAESGDPAQDTADNTGQIVKQLNQSNKNQKYTNSLLEYIGEYVKGIGDVATDMHDQFGEFSSGTYSFQAEKPSTDIQDYSFSDRFDQFMAEVKGSTVFSLPSALETSIPSGGSSTLLINGGETFGGEHTIDFSDWPDSIWLTIRGIITIFCGIIAIRIITLKR